MKNHIVKILYSYANKILRKLSIVPKVQPISINNVKASTEELIFPESIFDLPEKPDIFGQKHENFSGYTCDVPQFYVRSIQNGKCVVGSEEIFTSDDQVIQEFTAQEVNPFIGGDKQRLNNPYRINASVANLSLSGLENNYYHWLTECLGRYYLLEKSKFKPDFYILSRDLPFQKQYIELLGIDPERILNLDANVAIQANDLIIPSFINNWKYAKYRGYNHCLKQWLPIWTGNIYRELMERNAIEQNHNKQKNKIYISRAFANYRRIENEDEVIDFLKNKGYGIYHLENMSVHEQVELFSNASIVLGAHGAGFSNIYFCSESTTICELFSEYYHDSSYRILSNVLGLKYNYMIGKTNIIKNINPLKENIYIDLKQLKAAIALLDDSLID
jgi:capsular polysaccharide biosynthesis protein